MKNKNKTVFKGLLIAFAMLITVHLNAQCPKKKEIKFFGEKLAKHILDGEKEKALDFFDPDYREEQLERNLNGNTTQFLEEFLSAFHKKNDFIVPSLEGIKKIKIKRVILQNTSKASLVCKIWMNNKISYKTELSVICKNNKELYFIGPMG
jgi:hypothetical protein